MERCFSCAEIGKCTELYARKPFDYRGPYFPIFERFNPPSSSNSISPEGTVKVCELCHIFLMSQWQNYERQGVIEARRIYFTKRHDNTSYNSNDHYLTSNSSDINYGNKSGYSLTKNGDQRSDSINLANKTPSSGNIATKGSMVESQGDKQDPIYDCTTDQSSKQLTEHHICCFVCGLPCLKWHAKTAYSSQVLENKEYFPFFEKLDPPQLSIGLTNGATKICIQCETDLQKQWEHYETLGTDQMLRTYHITNEHNNTFSITNPGRFITNSMMSNPLFSIIKMKNNTVKCALCPNKVIDPYTVSWSSRASCLVISNLKNFPFPNDGVMVDKQSEEAIICDVCHYFLSYQMQAYNTNMTPLHLREYKLPKVGALSPMVATDKQNVNNTNNAAITTTPNNNSINNNTRKPVTLGSSLSAFSAPEGWQQSTGSQSKRSKTPTQKPRSKTPTQFTENNRLHSAGSITKPIVGNHDQSSVLGPIIANCHICLHELRDPNNLKTLPSAVNEETPDQAYFPFLKTLRMNSMKNYEFPVCVQCYYNLHGQWRMFHKAAVPIYERKYNYNEFMCTQCQHLFAQKTDIVIVRDRLLCVSCSENRACDATKNTVNLINQDPDAASHNAVSLLSMKTKTTVTVTPISNELSSGPNLASLNYADTMKQLNVTKMFDGSVASKPISTGASVSLGNSLAQFSDSSRHSEIYQNSKNMFSKNMKRPAIAAVAPNQRQNTPHMSSDSINTTHSDMRLKMPDNPFAQNPAYNYGNNGNSNYSMPMFSPGSAFALHSPHSRKSSKSDRDNFLPHTSNQYFDPKSRINTPLAPQSASNPFINWTQPHHPPESQNHGFPVIPTAPNPFEPFMPAGSSNKETDMTMLLYMMYQKQMQMAASDHQASKLPGNYWFGNPGLDDMSALSYYQTMIAQQNSNPALMLPPDDMMSGAAANSNIQSYMMNAAMANYQYNQMLQMIAACQQNTPSTNINNKPATNFPSWFNQISMADQVPKRPRPETVMFDQLSHPKTPSMSNGFNDVLRYSELLKSSSMGNEYEKFFAQKFSPMHINTFNPAPTLDGRLPHQKSMESIDTFDKLKTSKHIRDEYPFSDIKPSPKQSTPVINIIDSKVRKPSKGSHETGVLDLSQSKPSYKSPYAIDSLTELRKSCDIDSQDNDQSCHSSVPLPATMTVQSADMPYSTEMDLELPLEMHNKSSDHLKPDQHITSASESHSEQDRLINLLKSINASSLINTLKSKDTAAIITNWSKASIPKLNKCQTPLKFHKFLNHLNRLFVGCDDRPSNQTRSKSSFMKLLGLQNTSSIAIPNSLSAISNTIMNRKKKSPKYENSANERYWTNWILTNLQHRLSIKVKPHLRRSLMRPVLSGEIEVRLCTAKHKHELVTVRSIIKILKRFT